MTDPVYCPECHELLPGYVHTCPDKVVALRDQLAARDRELAESCELLSEYVRSTCDHSSCNYCSECSGNRFRKAAAFLARRTPTNKETDPAAAWSALEAWRADCPVRWYRVESPVGSVYEKFEVVMGMHTRLIRGNATTMPAAVCAAILAAEAK